MKKNNHRFRYLLRPERREELIYQLEKDFPERTRYNIYEIQYFLRIQGFHLQEAEISKMVNRIYCREDQYLSLQEAIGLYGRLSIDQQVEADFRNIFQFFTAGQEYITAQELKVGLMRLGESLKDKEINQIFVELDLNFNGYINFETFLEAMVRQ